MMMDGEGYPLNVGLLWGLAMRFTNGAFPFIDGLDDQLAILRKFLHGVIKLGPSGLFCNLSIWFFI
jgi:hypothetical protein